MEAPPDPIAREIDALVEHTRERCLWFLRPDYLPTSDAERLRVLISIQQHGTRDDWVAAERLRRWLSQRSSANS
jgi:hypothetical protein